jgi:hypothetical protein
MIEWMGKVGELAAKYGVKNGWWLECAFRAFDGSGT